MIVRESFLPHEIQSLVVQFNNALSVDNLYKIDFSYDSETRSFSVGFWTRPEK